MKKILLLLISMVLILGSLTGCGDSKTKKPGSQYRDKEGDFVVEKAAAEFYVDGKKIGMPFKLADLGEGYELDHPTGDVDVSVCIYKDGELLFTTHSYDYNYYQEIGEVEEASFYGTMLMGQTKIDLNLGGVRVGDKVEKVLETFGEPSLKIGSSLSYEKSAGAGKYLIINIKDDKVEYIDLAYSQNEDSGW